MLWLRRAIVAALLFTVVGWRSNLLGGVCQWRTLFSGAGFRRSTLGPADGGLFGAPDRRRVWYVPSLVPIAALRAQPARVDLESACRSTHEPSFCIGKNHENYTMITMYGCYFPDPSHSDYDVLLEYALLPACCRARHPLPPVMPLDYSQRPLACLEIALLV